MAADLRESETNFDSENFRHKSQTHHFVSIPLQTIKMPKGQSQASNDARAASFNPQHAAYNPTSQNAGSAMGARSQASMDARAASFNPQHAAYNPNTAGKK